MFFRNRNRKRADSLSDRAIDKLDGRKLRYAVRRRLDEDGNTEEWVLGRDGYLGTTGGWVTVTCGGGEVFRADRDAPDTTVAELMSLDGVMLRGHNQLTGEPDTVIAYYRYYR